MLLNNNEQNCDVLILDNNITTCHSIQDGIVTSKFSEYYDILSYNIKNKTHIKSNKCTITLVSQYSGNIIQTSGYNYVVQITNDTLNEKITYRYSSNDKLLRETTLNEPKRFIRDVEWVNLKREILRLVISYPYFKKFNEKIDSKEIDILSNQNLYNIYTNKTKWKLCYDIHPSLDPNWLN